MSRPVQWLLSVMLPLAMLGSLAAVAQQRVAFDSKALFEKSKAGVVQINLKSFGGKTVGNGSGFLVEGDGLVVTNHHVVDQAQVLEVAFVDGRHTTDVELIGDFPDTDLAVLALRQPVANMMFELADTTALSTADPLAIIGSPMGLGWTLTEGKVAAYRPEGLPESITHGSQDPVEKMPLLQMSVPVAPGNSGGPVLDAEGRVVGVVQSQLGFGTAYSFAVPTAAVRAALLSARTKPMQPKRAAVNNGLNRLWVNLAVSVMVLGAAAWFIFKRR